MDSRVFHLLKRKVGLLLTERRLRVEQVLGSKIRSDFWAPEGKAYGLHCMCGWVSPLGFLFYVVLKQGARALCTR